MFEISLEGKVKEAAFLMARVLTEINEESAKRVNPSFWQNIKDIKLFISHIEEYKNGSEE